MAFPYRVTQEAHEEYIEAYVWYEIRQKGVGDKFTEFVEQKLERISDILNITVVSRTPISEKQKFRIFLT